MSIMVNLEVIEEVAGGTIEGVLEEVCGLIAENGLVLSICMYGTSD